MFTTECPLSGGIASTVGLHPIKTCVQKHIFVMLTTPQNNFSHPKYRHREQFFGVCKTPMQKFGNFSRIYALGLQFTSVVSNTV